MAERNIVVKDKVGIVDYSAAVFEIVSKFFDENGNYTPHFGNINSVGVFYRYFVDEKSLESYIVEAGYNFSDTDIDNNWAETVLADDYLMGVYNTALKNNVLNFSLNFGNAYQDAIEIVEFKKSSLENVVENIGKVITSILKDIGKSLNESNVEKLSAIATAISKGSLTSESIVDSYLNSDKIKTLMGK